MKAQWKDGRYNFFFLHIGKFTVQVGWDKGGYAVTFEGVTLAARFQTAAEAKAVGEKFARKVLTEALQALGE